MNPDNRGSEPVGEGKSAEQLEMECLLPESSMKTIRDLRDNLGLEMSDIKMRLIAYSYLNFDAKAAEAREIAAAQPAGRDTKTDLIIKACGNVRGPFERMDDTVFSNLSGNRELLDKARQTLVGPINESTKGIMEVGWPKRGDLIDDEIHNPLNNGGHVDVAETAVVRSLGKVRNRSRVKVI
jgi:hypothetical protein